MVTAPSEATRNCATVESSASRRTIWSRNCSEVTAPSAQLRLPASHPGLLIRDQDHLQLGVGGHHGGDVAALDDHAAGRLGGGDQRLLPANQLGPDVEVGGGDLADAALIRGSRIASVTSVTVRDHHLVLRIGGHLQLQLPGAGRRPPSVSSGSIPCSRTDQVDRAVHRTRVQVLQPQPGGDSAGGARLAGPARAVHSDDHGPEVTGARTSHARSVPGPAGPPTPV